MSLPLAGVTVLDLTRMLPGAVLARTLIDLGARLVKVEEPSSGDPMRAVPPLVDGLGAGFAAFFRGAESVALDIRTEAGARSLLKLVRGADVLVESYRPGALASWGLAPERFARANPALVHVSLPGYDGESPFAASPAHDLNLSARAGALSLLPDGLVPPLQLADVTTGLLAAAALLGALLTRQRTGRGTRIEQPLASGPLPFVAWAWADALAGGESGHAALLSGRCPAYTTYRCADGVRVALGALEPKFWGGALELLGLPHLVADALDAGERGHAAKEIVAARFAERPSAEWLADASAAGLPLTRVNAPAEALADPAYEGVAARGPALELSFVGRRRELPAAPALGAHTRRVLEEFGAG